MEATLKLLITSPALLVTTSVLALSTAMFLIHHVKTHGPIPVFRSIMKYNSIFYSLFSLILCFCITSSYISTLQKHRYEGKFGMRELLCLNGGGEKGGELGRGEWEERLRLVYHASKIWEYVDIFNVLAVGGSVNVHFWVHHFTTPYLTYVRVVLDSKGWHIPAILNTFHHALMYAYFGGVCVPVFSPLLPYTGYLQLITGLGIEIFILRGGCGSLEEGEVWMHGFGGGMLVVFGVLFFGDVVGRGGKGGGKEKGEKGEKGIVGRKEE